MTVNIASIREVTYFAVTTDGILPDYLREPGGRWWHSLVGVWVLADRADELEAAFVVAHATRLRGEAP